MPEAVDPARLFTVEWQIYHDGLGRADKSCFDPCLRGWPRELIARQYGMTVKEAQARWDSVWQNWLLQRESAVASRDCREVARDRGRTGARPN